ncbi:collagen alpha-1(III) chain-like [Cervus canadensis]|uniref:collagen alpha-1(III) chain-like n=1 Tax=Cervus canadensis TaxID=1574408 RepID=UPI001C9E5261|nr:collagen alpha-1(III) chain-like [Cervus canadensis]
MHGLIFETSICYWQDQPGRGASTRSRACREQGGWWWPETRASCGSGRAQKTRRGEEAGRRGCGREGAHPTHRPHTRGEDARSRTQPSVHEGHSAPRRPPPRGGTRGGARRVPLLLRTPTPPRREPARPGGPGSRAGDPRPGHAGAGRRALKRPSVPPTPEGRGTPGGEDAATGPREADRGPDPRSGERIGAGGAAGGGGWWGGGGGRGRSPSPSPRRRRRTGGGGGKAGNGSGPRQARGSETRQGAGPGEQQTGSGPRRTDGRTERGTDGVRPCDTNATEPAVEAGVAARHREGDGSKRPGGSESAARAHRGISPPEASQHRGGPEAHPERQTGLSGHPPPPRGGGGAPLTGPHAHRQSYTRSRSQPGRTLSRRGSEGTAPPGDATGRRRPGDDTHVRRGRLGPRPQGAGVEGDTGGRTRGTRRKAGSGKPARDPTATHTRGRSRNAWDAGRSWPSLERAPHPSPAARAGVPTTQPSSIHPSILPQQIRLPSKPDPEAQHPGDTLSSKGGPDRAHHTATGCGSGARAGTTGSSSPQLQGWGSRGRPGSRTPTPPPSPWAHTTGPAAHNTAHTAPHSPDTRQGPAGPSPNSEGGGAGRIATVATAHSGGAAAGGSGTPRLPLGSLEKAFSPRAHRPSPDRLSFGPTEAHQEPPLNWAGGVCGIASPTTSPPPAHNLTPQARAANDPRRRTADTWHGAYRAGVVPAATGCPQRGAQGQRPTPPRPTALGSPSRGTTSWVGQTRHTGAGAQAQAGGSSGKGRTRRQLAAHRPGAPRASRDPKSSAADTKGDRVSTYLVAKKTYFGRQNDSRRQRGPSMTRREGPRNLDPATCPQHYPMNIRPGALGGHLVDLGGGERGPRGGKSGGADAKGEGAGRRLPPRFAHTGRRTGPSESPNGDLTSTCIKKKEGRTVSGAPPTRRAGPDQGPRPGPRPSYTGHPGRLEPVPTHLLTDRDSGSWGGREPEGPDPAAPSADLHATVRAGPHIRSGAEGEANAPEGDPGGGRTAESESRRSGQGRPSPCPPRRSGPGLAEAPEVRDNIKAAARWLLTTGSTVPRTGRCRRPPRSHRAGRPNAGARAGASSASEPRDATRPRPQRKGEELGTISSGGCPEGDALPPRDSRVVGGRSTETPAAGARGPREGHQ